MKKIISIIIMLTLAFSNVPQIKIIQAYANESDNSNRVIVSENIESNDGTGVVTWTKDKTYVVCSQYTDTSPKVNCKLIIEPGTTILLGTGTGGLDGTETSEAKNRPYPIFRIGEKGSIEAKGTKEEPITFKNISTHLGWNGIEIALPDKGKVTDTFEYCKFINGGAQFEEAIEGVIDVIHGTKETKFNLVIDHCTFDSTELESKNILQQNKIGAGLCYGDYNGNEVEADIKVSDSIFRSLSMGIEGVTFDDSSEVYNEKSKCIITNNTFENNIISSYNSSIVWGGNAEIRNNTFYTVKGGALTKNALDLVGQCNYVIEGNIFHGSQSTEKGKMNECEPVAIRYGSKVNADITKNYKENKCDYATVYGKLVKITGDNGKNKGTFLGKIEGLGYVYNWYNVGDSSGVKSKLVLAPGTTHYISSLDVRYNGELEAKGTKDKPIKFISAEQIGIDNGAEQIGLYQNADSEYLEGKATFENCEFDGVGLDAIIVSKSTGSSLNGKIPLVFSVKNCVFKNVSSGLDIGIDSYYDYVYGSVLLENLDIKGEENNSFTGMYVSVYGKKIPKGNVFKATNCSIHNFKYNNREGQALQLSVDEESSDKVVFENITMAGNYYGILATMSLRTTKLPIIKNCIISGNKEGFKLNSDTDTSNVTYTCIWNEEREERSYGEGCIFKDPLFADLSSGDLHLKSKGGRWNGTKWVSDTVTSPCINAGNPLSDYSKEPTPNGNRINMGAYGNTSEASKTDDGSFIPNNPTTENKITNKETTVPKTNKKQMVKLKTPVIKAIGKSKKKISIIMKKIQGKNQGYYEIQYSNNRKFKNVKTKIVKASKTKVIIKKLKSKKRYYVRVRLYRKITIKSKKKKIYSSWSKVKTIKTK